MLALALACAWVILPAHAHADQPAKAAPHALRHLSLGGDDASAQVQDQDKGAVHASPANGEQLVAWRRLAGMDALGTMERIVNAGWKNADAVVVCTLDGYWDAVCANALAGQLDAPVLMTKGDRLSAETARLIKSLGASKAYICGGTAAVSSAVQRQVKAQLSGSAEVVRLAGKLAVGTSAAIASEVSALQGEEAGDTCIIATDTGYWDALAAGPYSYAKGVPIILARAGKRLDPEAVAAISKAGYKKALIAGGTAAVSRDVETQASSLGLACTRAAGIDAFETAVKLAEHAVAAGMSPKRMGVATAQGYWDALSGAAFCGKNNAVLLMGDDRGHFDACTYATKHRRTIGSAYVFGGEAAVGKVSFADLKAATLEHPVNTYTLSFKRNGGKGSMASQTMKAGKYTQLPRNRFTRTGYDFVGWNTKADGSGDFYPDTGGVASLAAAGGRATLYAQWKVSVAYLREQLGITTMWRRAFDHGPKPASVQKYIMLHDTEGTGSPASVVHWWDVSGAGVAAHFIVGRDGSVVQCVDMDRIAHHAGFGNTGHNWAFGVTDESRDDKRGTVPIGSWASDYGMNSYSIGIEMVHVGGGAPYTSAQLYALDDLIAYIDAYYGFESAIIDHKAWRSGNSDTSPEFAGYLANYKRYRHH